MPDLNPHPLVFKPLLKPKVWGGRHLERFGKSLPAGESIGESWEIADLPDAIQGGRSVIANGPLAGMTLREAVTKHPSTVLGDAPPADDGGFPLLIKYLDARENLSVQVHPSPEYAAAHPESHLKSEAWYIVHAEPGAVIYKGVDPSVTAKEFARHIASDEVVKDLLAIPVQPGDCHYLPSGTCHALGAGIVVAEVQTPSDTTFRVYDWGRTDRQLHVEQALACIKFGESLESEPPPIVTTDGGVTSTRLTCTEFFEITRVDASQHEALAIQTANRPEVWMHLDGEATIEGSGFEPFELTCGVTALIPAALTAATANLVSGASLLRITLPS